MLLITAHVPKGNELGGEPSGPAERNAGNRGWEVACCPMMSPIYGDMTTEKDLKLVLGQAFRMAARIQPDMIYVIWPRQMGKEKHAWPKKDTPAFPRLGVQGHWVGRLERWQRIQGRTFLFQGPSRLPPLTQENWREMVKNRHMFPGTIPGQEYKVTKPRPKEKFPSKTRDPNFVWNEILSALERRRQEPQTNVSQRGWFLCPYPECKQQFAYSDGRTRHKNSVHGEQNPYHTAKLTSIVLDLIGTSLKASPPTTGADAIPWNAIRERVA